jgi:NAD(P)-dependent dehydrogenase (short-subunit alcohol dehydrogenase family)
MIDRGVAMSKSIALHCADNGYGIRVNVFYRGGIKTDMVDRFVKEMNMPEAEAYALRQTHPLGRFGSPEEIADAALYFASDASGFTTGVEL